MIHLNRIRRSVIAVLPQNIIDNLNLMCSEMVITFFLFFRTRLRENTISSNKTVNLTSPIAVIVFVPRRVAMFLVTGIHSVTISVTVRAYLSSVRFGVPIVLMREPNSFKTNIFSVPMLTTKKVHRVDEDVLVESTLLILDMLT